MAKKITLHLMHCSMHASATDAEFQNGIEYAISQGPDIASFTEMAGFHDEMRAACKNTPYVPVFFSNNVGEAFIVRAGEKHIGIKDKGNVQAHPGDDAKPGQGAYPPRYINWVKVLVDGNIVYYHTGHWIAHLAEFNTPQRVKRSNLMSQQMAIQVRKHGQGDDLSFFSGDTNQDDKPNEDAALGRINSIFRDGDLLTIWDEQSVYPPTNLGRTIDVVGRFAKDGRVKATRHKVYSLQPGMDHRYVSAWYEFTDSKNHVHGGGGGTQSGTGGNGNSAGGGGDTGPKDPDFYATGGNIDWSDYADGDIYDLPQATDDSDGSNH